MKKTKVNILSQEVLNFFPGLVGMKDVQGTYFNSNQALLSFLGLSSFKQLKGRTDFNFFSDATAQRLGLHDQVAIAEKKETTSFEELRFQSGRVVQVLFKRRAIFTSTNQLVGIIINIIEINELIQSVSFLSDNQHAKTYLDNILTHIPGSVYWKDVKGVYLGCNDFVVKMAGVKNRDEIIGKTDYELPWKIYASELRKIDQKIITTNKPLELEEYPTLADGTKLIMLTQKAPLRDEHGNAIGIIGVSVDITERKRSEQALKEAKEQAEAANRTKTEFIQNMEHDIRTPIGGLFAMAEIIERKETDESKKEILSAIKFCAKETLDYCNSILEFARTDLGIMPILSMKFNLKQLIQNIVNLETLAAQSKKLELLSHYSLDMPEIFIGDENRLKFILVNLVSNAIKFTKKGYVKISVDVAQRKDNQIIIRLYVEDTGIGIPHDQQTYIYEKFNRLTPSNRGLYKGSGLGLTLVKQYISDLEGEVDVKSKINQGTTFVCTIPLKLPLVDEVPFEDEHNE